MMKTLAALALAGFLALVGCSESDTAADASYRVEANISGMDCTGCTYQVCAAVEKIAGVTGATADLETGKFTVALQEDADAAAAMAEIEKIIAGLSNGKYTVGGIEAITSQGKPPSETENPGQDQELGEDGQKTGAIKDDSSLPQTETVDTKNCQTRICSRDVFVALRYRVAPVERARWGHVLSAREHGNQRRST